VDSRGPASLYLASDSRISWGAGEAWDQGKKLFVTDKGPHLLGYIGDVVFPSLALAQVTSAIDRGLVFSAGDQPSQRFGCVQALLKTAFDGLPLRQRRPFTVVYATRQLDEMDSTFHVFTSAWSSSGWKEQEIITPDTSSAVCVLGSGGAIVSKWQERWNSSSQGGTSRAVFRAFCDAIQSGDDPFTGGAPQLVGLYRKGGGRFTGIVWKNRPFLFGLPIELDVAATATDIEWRNSIFERCKASGTRVERAKKHHLPKGLGQRET